MAKRENMSSVWNDSRILRRCASGFDWNTVNTGESFYFGDNNNFTITQGTTDLTMSETTGHIIINNAASLGTKTVRLNSQTFTADASIIGLQTKPRAGVNLTNDICGIEVMPGVNSTFTGKGIVGVKVEPYLGSTAGAMSGDIRSFETTLSKPSGAGAVSGGIYGILMHNNVNNAGGAISNGVYPIYLDASGDNQAWSGFAVFPDDGQIATTSGDKSGGTKGWIKVLIGASTMYIQAYAGA